jgi:hypothetical protein
VHEHNAHACKMTTAAAAQYSSLIVPLGCFLDSGALFKAHHDVCASKDSSSSARCA